MTQTYKEVLNLASRADSRDLLFIERIDTICYFLYICIFLSPLFPFLIPSIGTVVFVIYFMSLAGLLAIVLTIIRLYFAIDWRLVALYLSFLLLVSLWLLSVRGYYEEDGAGFLIVYFVSATILLNYYLRKKKRRT